MSSDDRSKLKTLDRDLKSVVFGQDPAIDALAAAIKMARSGLGKPDKPIGTFLFSGPTGVGKTEVAKQLAYILGIELIRFDMSEYMERHAVSRLIGAPPGYVGFDQGGLLTEAISKKPHAVLLLDEIEKAHPDVFNVLLQVMDHGTLTDNNGRKADFRSVIIVMTTNAGAETMNKATIGFTTQRETGDEMADIKRLFTPEFRNRLDAIVNFRALDEEIILRVVDKFLLQLESQLAEKKVEVTFTDALRKHLAKKGFDPLMGARPMQRLIQDTIRRALADELLFGRLVDGGRLTVDIDDKGEVLLDIQPPRRATRRGRRSPRLTRRGRCSADRPTRRSGFAAPPQGGNTCGPAKPVPRCLLVRAAESRPLRRGPAGSSRRAARTAPGVRRACPSARRRRPRRRRRRTPPGFRRRRGRARCPRRRRRARRRPRTRPSAPPPSGCARRCWAAAECRRPAPSPMSSTWANSCTTTL